LVLIYDKRITIRESSHAFYRNETKETCHNLRTACDIELFENISDCVTLDCLFMRT